MKLAILLIIVIHGLIHVLGFLKAFELAKVEGLKMPITKTSGIIWLITALLFLATSVTYLVDSYLYLGLGASAVTLSQALIWQHWKDAKYGTIPNLILGIILFLSI